MARNIIQPIKKDSSEGLGGILGGVGTVVGGVLGSVYGSGNWAGGAAAGNALGSGLGNAIAPPTVTETQTPGLQLKNAMERRAGDIAQPNTPTDSPVGDLTKSVGMLGTGLSVYNGFSNKAPTVPTNGTQVMATPAPNAAQFEPLGDPNFDPNRNAMLRRYNGFMR